MASDSKAKFLREGERYVQQGKISLAINEYLKITREDPDDVLTQNTVGDLYLRQGRVSEANQIFLQIAENYARNNFLLKAIAVYRKVLNTEPVNYDVSLKLASLYVRQGLNVDARNLYIAIGDLCAREGKNSEALEALEKAVEIDSTNVPIQLRLADAYLGQGSNDKAYGFLIGAARAQMKKGDIGASMGSFRHALAIRIGSSEALKGFLESALEADGLSASIAQVRESIDAADTDPALREVLGRAYMKEGDLDHAETCFETALAVDESRYVNFLSLFNTFLEGGKLDRALHCLDRIVPILISKRETQKLTECYDAILVRDPDHIDTLKQLADLISGSDEIRYRDLLERLARLYRINDRPGEALGIVERMLELYPDSEKHLRDHRELFGIVFPNLSYKSPTGEIDLHKRSGQVPAGLGNGDPDAGGPALVEIDLLLNYGMKDKALQLLSTMEFKKPSDKEVRLRLLSVYRECGEDRLAAQQAVLISTLYRKSGDKENAQKYWNEAVGLDSEWVNSGFDLVAFAADHGIQLEPEKIETAQQPGTLEVDLSGDLSEIFFKDAPAEAEANEEPAPDLIAEPAQGTESAPEEFPQDLAPAVSEPIEGQLQEVDFYIRLGFQDEARAKLDHLAAMFPGHPDLVPRYAQLGVEAGAPIVTPAPAPPTAMSPAPAAEVKAPDFSGLLFDAEKQDGDIPSRGTESVDRPVAPEPAPAGNFEFGNELAIDLNAGRIPEPVVANQPAPEPVQPSESRATNTMFSDLITEMNSLTDQEVAREDFETHFHLGIAFREMGLIEDAIKEFQTSMKILGPGKSPKEAIQCCGMLSTCFLEKGMSRSAIRWCQTGLQIREISAHETMALRYDMAVAHAIEGNSDQALECYKSIFADDPSYRDVAQKIDTLKAGLGQHAP